ncbi:siphovirus ReqiPepy6 Gp37-like family protein [Streptomyces sp. CC77]|uniref:siphovirus ReqiPepy6 Gp37-like family protein n=1 Tax=Streptomyces sp. CC77 TaxID=1906739 RepID=UPI000AB1742D|nr:siphovirus ReqiPepy6 Gp37-like family protein [Streptomyces sp. CC77]
MIRPEDLSLELEDQFNNVGTWKATLPSEHPLAAALRLPGAGLVITGPGDVLMSGPVVSSEYAATPEDRFGSIVFEGVSDSVILLDMLAWPEPANADVTTQKVGHDERTGPAETLMHAYVNANCGPGAPAARRRARLVMGPNGARGPVITKSARFPTLGELLTGIAAVGDLGFRIVQRGSQLVFETFQVTDRTREIRLDVLAGTLAGQRVAVSTPGATRVIVAGQGEQEDRTFVPVDNTASIAAEGDWGRRIERFVDQRNTSDQAELSQAGNEVLAEDGFTKTAIQAVPVEDSSMEFGIDWGLGDRVSVIAGGQELTAPVTGLVLKAADQGFRVGALLGDPTGFDPRAVSAQRTQDTERRVSALERTAEASPPGPRMLPANRLTQASRTDDYPEGASVTYLTADEATAGGWDFGGKYGYLTTQRHANGDAFQTWSRVHAATTNREDWVRGGNRSTGWAPWRHLGYEQIISSDAFTQATPPSAYPYGESRLYINTAAATSGGWDFAPMWGYVRTVSTASGYTTQNFTRLGRASDPHQEWVRHGSPESGWSAWRSTAFTDETPRGVKAIQNLATSPYVGDAPTLIYTQGFTAEANRCYKVVLRIAVADTDGIGDNTDSGVRYAKQGAYTAVRWAAGTTVSASSTIAGDFYSTTFDDDSSTATGLDITCYINNPPPGPVTVGVTLNARRTAATYGSVRYLPSAMSQLVIEDAGAAV